MTTPEPRPSAPAIPPQRRPAANRPLAPDPAAHLDLLAVPADCPLLSRIEARLTQDDGTLLIQLYGPAHADTDATIYVRYQLFTEDGLLLKHSVSAHSGKAVNEVIHGWERLPAFLRRSGEVLSVEHEDYLP